MVQYGEAGKGLGGDAQRKFGERNVAAGRHGEQHLAAALQRDPMTSQYTVWKSLRIPSSPGGTKYSSDVDIAVASGNRLVLVDAKMWKAGKFYWTFMGMPMQGTTPMKAKISKNMAMAVDRYQRALPNCRVSGIVVFVPTSKGGMPTSVRFLKWPGNIRSFTTSGGIVRIRKLLGSSRPPVTEIQALLGSMTR